LACSPMNLNCFGSRLICFPHAFATLEKGVEDLTTNVTGSPVEYLTLICSNCVRACHQRHSLGLVSRHATRKGRSGSSRRTAVYRTLYQDDGKDCDMPQQPFCSALTWSFAASLGSGLTRFGLTSSISLLAWLIAQYWDVKKGMGLGCAPIVARRARRSFRQTMHIVQSMIDSAARRPPGRSAGQLPPKRGGKTHLHGTGRA
jgi:hypothetical protein